MSAVASLQRTLAQLLPITVRQLLGLFASLLTIRNLLIAFCVLNIKNLPLAWEIRLLYRGWRSWMQKKDVARLLREASSKSKNERPPASSHPIFAPLSITSVTPLLEIDHNIHKSNSCYFSDLDESRTALVIRLLSSTRFSPKELESEGFKGPFSVVLGSVHTSFLKEIKAYERYQVRSRILGWDKKWILIGSVFVRAENESDRRRSKKDRERRAKLAGKRVEELAEEEQRVHKGRETLLAVCLSKYVVKKGRFTVPPERCWRSAGWLPDRPPDNGSPQQSGVDSSASPTPDNEGVDGEVKITELDLKRRAQETAAKAAEKLNVNVKSLKVQEHIKRVNAECWKEASKWSWDDIEAQREQGMKVAESWLGLDKSLKDLWEEES